MEPLQHSFSSIKMFDNCAKRYYHQKITKEVVDLGGEASVYGNRIHKHMELRLAEGKMLPGEAKAFEEHCLAVEKMAGPTSSMFLEKKLAIDRQLKPCEWESDNTYVRSILDVLIMTDDKAVIMDWKTGKRRPDFFQLELSAAQVFIHYPEIKKINTAFVWLTANQIDKEQYNRKSLKAILKNVASKTGRIEEARELDVWPAKPSGLCSYCPANKICEFAQKSYRRR